MGPLGTGAIQVDPSPGDRLGVHFGARQRASAWLHRTLVTHPFDLHGARAGQRLVLHGTPLDQNGSLQVEGQRRTSSVRARERDPLDVEGNNRSSILNASVGVA